MPKWIVEGEEADQGRVDDLESDLRSLGIRNWKAKARNRNDWKAVVREAKVHFTGTNIRVYQLHNDMDTYCLFRDCIKS